MLSLLTDSRLSSTTETYSSKQNSNTSRGKATLNYGHHCPAYNRVRHLIGLSVLSLVIQMHYVSSVARFIASIYKDI